MRILDISRPLEPRTAPWPGDQPFHLEWTLRKATGASVNLSALSFSPHVGTHTDAPLHVKEGAPSIDQVDLEPYVGPVRVVRARLDDERLVHPDSVPERWRRGSPEAAGRDVSEPPGPPRLLFRTDTDPDPLRWPENFAALSPAAAHKAAEHGYRLVGIDTPSVDPEDSKDLPAHHALLEGGLRWLENLDLSRIEPGDYQLVALPLPIVGGDASPVRAVLITET